MKKSGILNVKKNPRGRNVIVFSITIVKYDLKMRFYLSFKLQIMELENTSLRNLFKCFITKKDTRPGCINTNLV